jgi:hypothetical protein
MNLPCLQGLVVFLLIHPTSIRLLRFLWTKQIVRAQSLCILYGSCAERNVFYSETFISNTYSIRDELSYYFFICSKTHTEHASRQICHSSTRGTKCSWRAIANLSRCKWTIFSQAHLATMFLHDLLRLRASDTIMLMKRNTFPKSSVTGGPMLWFLKYFLQKIAQKLAFLTQKKTKSCRNLIITLDFEKNANFSPKTVEIRRKFST